MSEMAIGGVGRWLGRVATYSALIEEEPVPSEGLQRKYAEELTRKMGLYRVKGEPTGVEELARVLCTKAGISEDFMLELLLLFQAPWVCEECAEVATFHYQPETVAALSDGQLNSAEDVDRILRVVLAFFEISVEH